MGDLLDMNNILTEDEAFNLFTDDIEETQVTSEPDNTKEEPDNNKETETTEVDPENLFDDTQEVPESVGSGDKEIQNQEDPSPEKDETSPDNFYSSIASALKEEGVLPDLNDEDIEAIKEPEDFRDLIQRQINAGMDEIHRRVQEALSNDVDVSAVRSYENTLGYLNSITEDLLTAETEEGETVRRKLIQQDLMNKGYTAERAVKLTERFFASGDDIDEARTALESNKEYFADQYDSLLKEAKKAKEQEKKEAQKRAENLKKDILNTETVLGDIKLDKATRQKVYDSISKPIYKDPDTGTYYTAVQKYQKENENDFIKYMGLFYTLTNGFKNMDNIIKPQAKKEIKSKLRELEHTLNGTSRNSNGTLKLVSSGEDKIQGNLFDKGYSIDMNN